VVINVTRAPAKATTGGGGQGAGVMPTVLARQRCRGCPACWPRSWGSWRPCLHPQSGVVTTEALKATIGDKGLIALRAGSAPPHVPAAVMLWLATSEQAPQFQRRTIAAQPFALGMASSPMADLLVRGQSSRLWSLIVPTAVRTINVGFRPACVDGPGSWQCLRSCLPGRRPCRGGPARRGFRARKRRTSSRRAWRTAGTSRTPA
jgi:hypothetical protein